MGNAATSPSRIPSDLLARLEALSPILCTNGTVRRREEPGRRVTWRLRYRAAGCDGRRHLHAISLPDEAVALEVAILIDAWQQQYKEYMRAARQADEARKDRLRRWRQRRREVQALGGGGWRRRKNIGRLYDQAAQRGLQEELAFILGERYRQSNRRPGRPPKSGLVLLT